MPEIIPFDEEQMKIIQSYRLKEAQDRDEIKRLKDELTAAIANRDGYKAVTDMVFNDCMEALNNPSNFSLAEVGWRIKRLRQEIRGLVVENSQLDNDLIGARETIRRLQVDLRDVKALLEASSDYSRMLEQLIHDCGFDLYTQEGTRTGLRNRNTRMIYLPER